MNKENRINLKGTVSRRWSSNHSPAECELYDRVGQYRQWARGLGVQVILAPTAELALTVDTPAVTVEAEYGDITVKGSRYTAAHHGRNAANPCPCVDTLIPVCKPGENILISHIDLDTLGGVARAMGWRLKLRHPFWRLAAFVDINGPHKLAQSGASEEDLAALYAYWAWSQSNRGPRRENDQTHDVTDEVKNHLDAVERILAGDEELLAAGEAFKLAGEALNEESFVEVSGGVIVRVSPAFTNHLYTTPSGEVCEAVVAFNTKSGSITLSFAEKDDERNACEIMQEIFGPKAGGHKGIAGSPRGYRLGVGPLEDVFRNVRGLLERE